ncbi:hypothetical protein L228DRAFT_83746 [Xylona heveae TC161]|uniref:Uncharacterized protein n=1 Tax=Xylona heveae (strain CBS 132557 / TC161) TaxID=1328760 RepID=A0A165J674_XYLHT|nr:hypothetical protein L228DRAFT_83746 [Xylona heveae TC161]KZF25788.1 hypothetical protein L228DRAFT_83746 [Xylona heveae TC161]
MPYLSPTTGRGSARSIHTGIRTQLWKVLDRASRDLGNTKSLKPVGTLRQNRRHKNEESSHATRRVENASKKILAVPVNQGEEILEFTPLEHDISLDPDFEDLFSDFEPLDEASSYSGENKLWDDESLLLEPLHKNEERQVPGEMSVTGDAHDEFVSLEKSQQSQGSFDLSVAETAALCNDGLSSQTSQLLDCDLFSGAGILDDCMFS